MRCLREESASKLLPLMHSRTLATCGLIRDPFRCMSSVNVNKFDGVLKQQLTPGCVLTKDSISLSTRDWSECDFDNLGLI